MKVFLDNREKVLSHNARFANGEVTFELGMNKFGDLLSTEFAAMYNGYTRKLRTGSSRTPGELDGVRPDTSRWLATRATSAELPPRLPTQLFKPLLPHGISG